MIGKYAENIFIIALHCWTLFKNIPTIETREGVEANSMPGINWFRRRSVLEGGRKFSFDYILRVDCVLQAPCNFIAWLWRLLSHSSLSRLGWWVSSEALLIVTSSTSGVVARRFCFRHLNRVASQPIESALKRCGRLAWLIVRSRSYRLPFSRSTSMQSCWSFLIGLI